MSEYTVKTTAFEGPLELLLSLIEKRKLFINDISLAEVTDEFIEYVNEQREFPVSQAAHFILVASTLLLIKSKSLLPALELTEEEAGDIEDLEHRLALYQRFHKLAHIVRERYGSAPLYQRIIQPCAPVFSPDERITIENLHDGVRAVCENLPQTERTPNTTVREIISLEETIDALAQRITTQLELRFRDFSSTDGVERKVEVIVGFLAMLELVKQGVISVKQENDFADIMMQSEQITTPRYD